MIRAVVVDDDKDTVALFFRDTARKQHQRCWKGIQRSGGSISIPEIKARCYLSRCNYASI